MTQPHNADGDVDRLRRVVAGTAHDLNNLLVVAMGCAELALDDQSMSPASRRLVQQVVHAVDRARALSERALRTGAAPPTVVDVAGWLTQSADLIERLVGDHVRLQVQAGEQPLPISGDASQIEQIVFNLALNARDAMPDGGTLTIAAAADSATPDAPDDSAGTGARRVRMTVADTGSGIEPALLQHMFEPYVTTKAAGKGSGLGLAVVRTVVDQLGGTVDVMSAPGEGTTFAITLPLAAAAEPAHSS